MTNDEARIKMESESTVTLSHEKNDDEAVLRRRGYTLEKLIGEGSYAKVFIAEFTDLRSPTHKQRLACKVINSLAAPKDFLKKFFPREIEIMSRVNHPNLVRVHSIIQRKNKYFLFMQYCENGDLLDFVRTNGAVEERQARIWFAQMVKGLKYLHDRDIVHRDLKCENILLTHAYNIKLADFGFSRFFDDKTNKSETFCGSVSYAAPEIIRGSPYDPKLSDLWSLGIILFVMVNKGMPFDDSVLKKMYESQITRTWKFRNKIKDRLSPEFKVFMYSALEPVPEKRMSYEKMFEDTWFKKADAEDRKHFPDFKAKDDQQRPSIFAQPSGHHKVTDEGVAILDADTANITYSRQILPLPEGSENTKSKLKEEK